MRALLVLSVVFAAASGRAQTPPCLSAHDVNDSPQGGTTTAPAVGANRYAFAITPSSALVVRGARLLTNQFTATTSAALEIWNHDSANQRPLIRLAGGVWQSPKLAVETWQGTNFDRPVSLAAQTTYWVVWTERGGHSIPVAPNSSPTFLTRQGNTLTGWTTATSNWAWKFRLYCSLLDVRGATPYGTACPSSASSQGTLFTSEYPQVGNASYGVEGSGFPTQAAAVVLLGADSTFSSIDLTQAGAPGCYLNTDILVVGSGITGAGLVGYVPSPNGHLPLPVPIPNDRRLVGAFFALQAAVHDAPSPNPLKFVTSNAMRTRVQ